MIQLAVNSLAKYYGANKIFDNVTFEAQTGERIGIIGRNGTGKTTVFKIIAGIERYDKGMLAIRKDATLGYLDQIPDFPSHYKVIDVIKSVFKGHFDLQDQMKDLEEQMTILQGDRLQSAIKKYGELQATFEHMGGYQIDEKINRVCNGLKIDLGFRERSFTTLSGGEKTTVVLSKILLQSPDILLLDEPSNHLDMDSIEWLEGFLREYSGTVLIISHDRYFLDRVVTKIVEIEDGETSIYLGNYSYYVAEKDRRLMEEFEAYQDQQKKIRAMEKAIKDLKAWGIQADNPKFHKRAASMQKRLDKMEKLDRPILDRAKIQLSFEGSERSGKDVIRINNVIKAFGDNRILDNLNLHIRYGEKVSIVGRNGSGKSTLIKILMGVYDYNQGDINIGSNVKIGYLEQDVTFPNEKATVMEAFREVIPMLEGDARRILSKFLFYGQDVFKRVESLSGGEKSRLRLCQLMNQDLNLLILDEPTNHLDIDSREMLEEALGEFPGTILFISHDRYFINKVAHRIVELEKGKLTNYQGNYSYYQQKRTELRYKQANQATPHPKPQAQDRKKDNGQRAPRDNNKGKELKIQHLELKIAELEQQIALKNRDMELFSSDIEKLQTLYQEKEKAQADLELLLEEWMLLNE